MENFLRKSIIGLLFLSVLTPFIVAETMFFPFITGKNFFFRILTEIAFFLWLSLMLYKPQFRPRFSFISVALVIFTTIVLIADIFAENPAKAFWSNFERMEGFVTMIHLLAYFIVIGSVFNTKKLWMWFARAYVSSSFLMSLFSSGQLFFNSSFYKNSISGSLGESTAKFLGDFFVINQGGVRVDGRLGNAAYLAGFLLISFFVALFLVYKDKIRNWRIFYIIALLLNLFVLYSTATRGAILGLFGGLCATGILILIFEKKDILIRKISMIALGIVIVSGLFVFVAKDSDFVKQNPTLSRLSTISIKSGDAQARFMIWNMAFEGFKERPILGWGQEGFNFVFNKYFDPKMHNREQWFDRTHNIFFDWLISAGIFGLLSYLSLLVLIFVYIWKVKGLPESKFGFSISEKAILTGLVLAYAFHNIFVFDNIVSYLMFFSLLAFFHHDRSSEFKKIDYKNEVAVGDIKSFYGPIFLVLFLLTVYFVNGKAFMASGDLIKALKSQKEGVNKNLDILEKALSHNSFANQEIREQMYQMAVTINSPNINIDGAIKSRSLALAEKELRKQVVETPTDARGYVFLGSLLSFVGNRTDAVNFMETALKLSPKKQVIKLALAENYLKLGDGEKSFTQAREAYELAPQFRDLATNFSIFAIYTGKLDEAKKVLIKEYGTEFPLEPRILKAYSDIGYRQKVLDAIRQNITKTPDNTELYILLAQIYLDGGMKQGAIDALRSGIKNVPSFKDQGEQYIKQISS